MSNGTVDIRTTKRNGKARLRFYNISDEQLEVILAALEKARAESDTQHDCVSLTNICQHYLVT